MVFLEADTVSETLVCVHDKYMGAIYQAYTHTMLELRKEGLQILLNGRALAYQAHFIPSQPPPKKKGKEEEIRKKNNSAK